MNPRKTTGRTTRGVSSDGSKAKGSNGGKQRSGWRCLDKPRRRLDGRERWKWFLKNPFFIISLMPKHEQY